MKKINLIVMVFAIALGVIGFLAGLGFCIVQIIQYGDWGFLIVFLLLWGIGGSTIGIVINRMIKECKKGIQK